MRLNDRGCAALHRRVDEALRVADIAITEDTRPVLGTAIFPAVWAVY
jgi:hypothetical protein